jgi:hypothetical protein
MERKKFSRRDFLRGGAVAGAGLILSKLLASGGGGAPASLAQDGDPTRTVYLPQVYKQPTPTPTPRPISESRVVHVRSSNATNWSGSGWYGSAVNQTVVDSMVQQGLQELTGQNSWAGVWDDLFSRVKPAGYQAGQKIAIKVNFNNSGYLNGGCTGTGNRIDALPQPVRALIVGLVAAGVSQSDIWIYDATGQHKPGRIIPNRFRDRIRNDYPSVQYHGLVESGLTDTCYPGINPISFGGDSSLTVGFSDSRLTSRTLTSLLYTATYLVNVPIIKGHGIHPVSLGFKNHFGSIDRINVGTGSDQLHYFINPAETSYYSTTYSPLVDIFKNPNIKNKTILTMGDALYGAFGAEAEPPVSWSTFGDAPNSLLFSADPVAIDCVMIDLLVAEGRVARSRAYDYLFCAQDAGLGVCEGSRSNPGGDPWQTPYGSGYSDIQYVRRNL